MHDEHRSPFDVMGGAAVPARPTVLVPPSEPAVEAVRAVPVARLALDARSVTRLAFLGITTAGALADASDDALLSAAATDDAVLETLMRLRWMVRRWVAALDDAA